MSEFTQQDLRQLKERGMDPDEIRAQIGHFRTGFPKAVLDRPATPGDGIHSFTGNVVRDLERYYDDHAGALKPVKFVPASGAASRMFKALFSFEEEPVKELMAGLEKIAFFRALDETLVRLHGKGADQLRKENNDRLIIDGILSEQGLHYASLPKGLLLFHDYPDGPRTAAEEHLVETASYARDADGIARIHFTISPEHREKFSELFRQAVPGLEKRFGVRYEITFSEQKPSTDTIAVDEDNQPFRNDDGSLLFRPGGHGALISNLNDLDGGIIFIKNIDNIAPDRLKPDTILYKKALGGFLLEIMDTVHSFLEKADQDQVDERCLGDVRFLMNNILFMPLPGDFRKKTVAEQTDFLYDYLSRPIRVCGMVRNEGEPGGGPFWVRGHGGRLSLQIIESSQVNLEDPQQKEILGSSTHFNPVDLVCCIKDHQGGKFDLRRFTDPDTGLVTTKSSGGNVLKAQELPGLWNGAMADWITVFAEVPLSTFNPVKTVNDLLRQEHRWSEE